MKEYVCGDVVPGCGSVLRTEDETELYALILVHGQHAHGVTDPQIPDDALARLRAAIHAVA